MKFRAAGATIAVSALAALIAGCEPDTVWSPDSKMLALDPHGMLVTYDLTTKKFQHRTFGPMQALNPTWSPDGKQLLYYSATVDKASEIKALKLALLDLSTGKTSVLSAPVPAPAPVKTPEAFQIDLNGRLDVAREVLTAAYSPDGKRLAYTTYLETKTAIWIADANGANAKPLTSLGKGPFRPVWSPDSARLAYFSEPVEESKPPMTEPLAEGQIQPQQTKHRLEVANADGTGARVLWDETRAETLVALGPKPEWSADGASLMAATDKPAPPDQPKGVNGPTNSGRLWTIPLEGEPKLLGELPGPTIFSTFSRGQVAFFNAPKDMNEKEPHLMLLSAPYNKPRELLQIPSALLGIKPGEMPEVDSFPVPVLSPDGKTISLMFVKKSGPVKLALFPADGGKPLSLDVPLKLTGAAVTPKAPAKKPATKPAPKRRQ